MEGRILRPSIFLPPKILRSAYFHARFCDSTVYDRHLASLMLDSPGPDPGLEPDPEPSLEDVLAQIEATLTRVRTDVDETRLARDHQRRGKAWLGWWTLRGIVFQHVWSDPVFLRLYPEPKRNALVDRIVRYACRWMGNGSRFLHAMRADGLKTTPGRFPRNRVRFEKSNARPY